MTTITMRRKIGQLGLRYVCDLLTLWRAKEHLTYQVNVIFSCVRPNGTFTLSTRKHSNRMRTARLLTGGVQGCLCPGVSVCFQGGVHPPGPRGTPPRTRRQTPPCEQND